MSTLYAGDLKGREMCEIIKFYCVQILQIIWLNLLIKSRKYTKNQKNNNLFCKNNQK